MWLSHRLIVQSADQPCFWAFQSLAAEAAKNRSRAFRLIIGSLPEGQTAPTHGFAFSAKCLWLSQDGVYILLPGYLPDIAGLRWVAFSKAPLVRSGITSDVLASIRYVRIQWSSCRAAWLVSFLYPYLSATSKRKRVYFPQNQ